ncbi:hypothetical protein AN189_17385 [Loktanella sp. 3ANDIMAR09]|uniref:hypothetical protein n=1 Tax=Loktanella sp. 3ANDIMAR09 TaxID=1225657 RepID=UPI0006F239DB|nr:hypothetical protein [Loktanella sp. 3ANDIMAR09]KQI67121.1 hypothetical protein AN189_17385 [Loktanella sp. 3ANDIMAR09]
MEQMHTIILDNIIAGIRPYWPLFAGMFAGLLILQIITSRFRIWRREALRQHYRDKVKQSRRRRMQR